MNLDDYQIWTRTTVTGRLPDLPQEDRLDYYHLKLVSEIGEIYGKLGKRIRGDAVTDEAILQECGDVLWYLTRLLDEKRFWRPEEWEMYIYGRAALSGLMRAAMAYAFQEAYLVLRDYVKTLDSTLEHVADLNYTKLTSRQARGVLQGNGDKR